MSVTDCCSRIQFVIQLVEEIQFVVQIFHDIHEDGKVSNRIQLDEYI